MTAHTPEEQEVYDEAYKEGLRDGRITNLENIVAKIIPDVAGLNKAVWGLYGAITIIGFIIPLIQKFLGGT